MNKKWLSVVAGATAAMLSTTPVSAAEEIVYLPSWAGTPQQIQWNVIDYVMYAFAIPNANGTVNFNDGKLATTCQVAHQNGKKCLLSFGGWNGGDDSGFTALAATANGRNTFAQACLNLMNQYGLDGIDLDWEYPAESETTNYGLLLDAIRARIGPNKLLTAAAANSGGNARAIQRNLGKLDFAMIMSYDGGSPHAGMPFAEQALNDWAPYGLGKTFLGVPFYGRNANFDYVGYNALLARGCSPDADLCQGYMYNGRPTIRAKRDLCARRGCRGLMAWEVSLDVSGANSLTPHMGGGGPVPTPTPTPVIGPTPTPIPGGGISPTAWYSLVAQNSSKCVDRRTNGTANGTVIQQFTCNNGTAQQWQFQPTTNGYYRVNSRTASAQVLDVSGGATATGNSARVHTWAYVSGTNQQWLPESMGTNLWRFRARHSSRCLDVPAASTADSLQLQQYDCNGTAAQTFRLQQQP